MEMLCLNITILNNSTFLGEWRSSYYFSNGLFNEIKEKGEISFDQSQIVENWPKLNGGKFKIMSVAGWNWPGAEWKYQSHTDVFKLKIRCEHPNTHTFTSNYLLHQLHQQFQNGRVKGAGPFITSANKQRVQRVLWGLCLKHDEGMVWNTFEIMFHYSPCRGEETASMWTEMEL